MWSSMNLQDSSSPMMENLIYFHDYSLMILMIITISIMYTILNLLINKFTNKFIAQNQMIEIVWTLIPMTILIYMSLPSLKILYLMDEMCKSMLTIKSISHQWYWKYEYSDFKNIDFNSFMIQTNDLPKSNFRLLEVDNRMIIPFNMQIRMLINSTDVIHSWAVPSLGIKMDAIPGRINQALIMLNRPGLFYGQCSEICGMNHSFMPIVIESTSNFNFSKWIKSF